MKKLTILLTVLMMICTLQGCSTSDHGLDPNNPVKITMWHYYSSSQKNAFDKLVSEFNATEGNEKGILVEAISQGGVSDLETALINSAKESVGSAALPDLFSAYASSAMIIDELHGLAALDDYMSESELSEYVDAYMEEGIIHTSNRETNGNHKLFPIAKATEVLMLNKTEWDKFSNATGVTSDSLATWEGLAQVAATYYEWSNGKAFFGRDAMANYILAGAYQLGHELFVQTDGVVSFQPDKDTMKHIYDNFYLPYIKGTYLNSGKYASDDVKTKDTIASVGSTSSSAYFPSVVTVSDTETEAIDYMVLPIPNFKDQDPVCVQQGASVAITKGDETKEYASIVFLRWLSENERNLTYAGETGYLPVKQDIDISMLDQIKDIKPVVKDTMEVALKQISESKLYTFKAFEKSSEIRGYIEAVLLNHAQDDRKAILSRVEAGEQLETVIKDYTADTNFDSWYDTFVKEITAMLESGRSS